jgi:acyl-CoA synthetase (AMP-forming)/AMP-acid ligase II
VAFVVRDADTQRGALAAHCRSRLPPEKLPQRYIVLKALPKLPNGKVDRQAIKAFALRQRGANPNNPVL